MTTATLPSPVRAFARSGLATRRGRTSWMLGLAAGTLAGVFVLAALLDTAGLNTNFLARNLAPSLDHPFGTDWLGRDMFTRTIKGLCLSLQVGLGAALCSTVVALALGIGAATMGKRTDALVTGMVDVVMSTPHLVMLILISFALGGGAAGVVTAVALTHWTRLARIIRAEILQLRECQFVLQSRKLGRSRLWIARHHMLPHVFPQFLVGLVLLFPHAIMHAAGLTFLGFGLTPHVPSIGILLAEAMRHLSTGHWWLAVAPGCALVLMVKMFDVIGGSLRKLLDPKTSQE